MNLKIIVVLAGIQAACLGARAQLPYSWTGSQPIPDNNGSGVAFGFTVTDPGTRITDVSVSLDISGGWNGDLYAYLSHGSGFAVLLNRPGVGVTTLGSSAEGYGDAGLAVRLSSAGGANVHFYANSSPSFSNGQLTGTWQPDGRGILPTSVPANFDAPGTADFSTFQNLDPNGQWTLFLSDASPLGISTLNGFAVDVIAVPEPPMNLAVGAFAVALVAFHRVLVKRRRS